ncbi:MAG: hypothetical protein PWQ77_2171 [Kosmotogales bacterium]|nr:hypothetical protein [Kosmotogales bacterium]
MGYIFIILIFTCLIAIIIKNISSNEKSKEEQDRSFFENLEISFTPHAAERLIEREITKEEVEKIINSRNTVAKPEKTGRIVLSNEDISVVCMIQGKKITIITVYINN